MKKIACIAMLCVVSPTHADVYKCTINGKTSFSDQPCAGQSQKLDVKPASGRSDTDSEQALSASKAYTEKVNKDVQKRQLSDSIYQAQLKVDRLTRERDAKLAELNRQKNQANNNLAGAVYMQSITNEMIAVTSAYEAKLKAANQELADLQAKLASLK